MEAITDMGQYGGVVIHTLKLFGEKLKPQAEVSGEVLLKVPIRNRRALRDSGFMRFFDEPRPQVKEQTTSEIADPGPIGSESKPAEPKNPFKKEVTDG